MNAETLHQESIVVDGHCDTLLRMRTPEPGAPPVLKQHGEDGGHIDLERLRKGGITAQNFACYVWGRYLPSQATRETLCLLDLFYRFQVAHADELCLATCASDIEHAKAEGKIAGILSMEGAEGLEGDLGVLRMMYRLGVRWLGLTWSLRNQAGEG